MRIENHQYQVVEFSAEFVSAQQVSELRWVESDVHEVELIFSNMSEDEVRIRIRADKYCLIVESLSRLLDKLNTDADGL